jgi:hypothetical protein
MRVGTVLGLLVTAVALSGCVGALDPLQRPGNWMMTGVSNQNIALQVADKSELISGHGETQSNGVAASAGLDKALGANGVGTAAGLQTTVTPAAVSDVTTSGVGG